MKKEDWILAISKQPQFDVKVLVLRRWEERNKKDIKFGTLIETGYLTDVITNRNGMNTEWHVREDYNTTDVTHWMPLPELPSFE